MAGVAVQAAPEAAVTLRLDSSVRLQDGAVLMQEAELFLPPAGTPKAVLFCLAGGGMNRRFFNLQADGGDASFSFAHAMTSQGYMVVAIDHLGLGGSDAPDDGHTLTTALLAQGNAALVRQILNGLQAGTLVAGLPALPNLKSIGVGHSMGAMLTVVQQAEYAQHDALVLMGFGTRGLPQFLPAEVREQAADTQAVRREIPRLAKAMFPDAYPRLSRSPREGDFYGGANADPRGVNALKAALAPMLAYPAYQSLLPGNVAPEAQSLRTPLLLVVGERDMVGEPQGLPAQFPASASVTLQVMPDTGHSHFLFPSRTQLFASVADWLLAQIK